MRGRKVPQTWGPVRRLIARAFVLAIPGRKCRWCGREFEVGDRMRYRHGARGGTPYCASPCAVELGAPPP